MREGRDVYEHPVQLEYRDTIADALLDIRDRIVDRAADPFQNDAHIARPARDVVIDCLRRRSR